MHHALHVLDAPVASYLLSLIIFITIGGDLAPSLVGTETFFRGANFRMTFL